MVVEAGAHVHLKGGASVVMDAGVNLTLMAGGQHLLIGAAGIYASCPILPGGVPIPGLPAVPLLPGESERLREPEALPTQIAPTQHALMATAQALGADFCPVCEACQNGVCLPEGASL